MTASWIVPMARKCGIDGCGGKILPRYRRLRSPRYYCRKCRRRFWSRADENAILLEAAYEPCPLSA